MTRDSVSSGRMVAHLGHIDSVNSAKELNESHVTASIDGMFKHSDVREVMREFGWFMNGATERGRVFFYKD